MQFRKNLALGVLIACACARGQDASQDQDQDQHQAPSAMARAMAQGMNETGMYLMNLASGTSGNPAAWPMPMIMTTPGSGWTAMYMANGFVVDTQESGPRGGDKLYSTNWFMGAFQHPLGSKATFEFDVMVSLEPATVTDRRYPELFQTGETAFGNSIVDGQHPHNFIMALGLHYVRTLSEHAMLDLYFAPVG